MLTKKPFTESLIIEPVRELEREIYSCMRYKIRVYSIYGWIESVVVVLLLPRQAFFTLPSLTVCSSIALLGLSRSVGRRRRLRRSSRRPSSASLSLSVRFWRPRRQRERENRRELCFLVPCHVLSLSLWICLMQSQRTRQQKQKPRWTKALFQSRVMHNTTLTSLVRLRPEIACSEWVQVQVQSGAVVDDDVVIVHAVIEKYLVQSVIITSWTRKTSTMAAISQQPRRVSVCVHLNKCS